MVAFAPVVEAAFASVAGAAFVVEVASFVEVSSGFEAALVVVVVVASLDSSAVSRTVAENSADHLHWVKIPRKRWNLDDGQNLPAAAKRLAAAAKGLAAAEKGLAAAIVAVAEPSVVVQVVQE